MRWLSRYIREENAVAAVEMALIAPFIAAFAVTSINVWDIGMRKQDMRGALKVGAEYYMNGGSTDATARSIALAQWNHKPATSEVTITRTFYCTSTSSTVANATTLCTDNTAPQILIQMHGTATTSTATFNQSQTADVYVRIR